jgi:hypothetical protein
MKHKLSLLLVSGLLAALPSEASIIYQFVGVTPSGPNFDWQYNAELSPDQRIDNTTFSNYAVIYDFLGAVSASTSNVQAGLTLNTAVQGLTAEPFAQADPDNPLIPNIRTDILGAFTGTVLTRIFTIDVVSTLGPASERTIAEAAQAVKNNPGAGGDGTLTGNTAQIVGPGASTPEPKTMLLFAGGLLAIGFLRRFRLRASL